MKPLMKRRLIDICISFVTYLTISLAGAGWWALLIVPFGFWNFYDGMTREKLEG